MQPLDTVPHSSSHNQPAPQHFVFSGRLSADSFQRFARHRAARLNLAIELGQANQDNVALSVRGDHDLVDMFEMAMSLGPHDCIVLDVRRTP